MNRLRVSQNRRFLEFETGEPFFYLADTAWELFHRLDRDEAEIYLRDRAEKRFTVVQAVFLAELDGLNAPNRYGECPLWDNDPTTPNEAYFRHVDAVIEMAQGLGLVIAALPTWGDKWNKKWGGGPEIFTPQNAAIYGEWLGKRYQNAPLIWVLGGDRPIETPLHAEIIRAMAQGLRKGDGGTHLMTFHPTGQESSAQYFHEDDWLDFNMLQSGHTRDRDNYRSVAADYARVPTKPCLDGEPGYEDHPSGFKLENGYLDAYDARKFAYWSLLAGAHGHTYGCHDIWQMWESGREPKTWARTEWRAALNLPAAGQMQFARAFIESQEMQKRVPDPNLLASEALLGTQHIQAARAEDGSYALIYSAAGEPFSVAMERLSGGSFVAIWHNPRTGERRVFGEFEAQGICDFTPPSHGADNDWALILTPVSS